MHQAVMLPTAQTDGEEMRGTGGEGVQCHDVWYERGLGGVQIFYRRSDHLICSLAD